MNDEIYFWAGFFSMGILTGYFSLDGYQSLRISRWADEHLVRETIGLMRGSAPDNLVDRSNAPEPMIRLIREWALHESPPNENIRYPPQFYRAAMREVESMVSIGPISWVSRRLTLRNLRKKLSSDY